MTANPRPALAEAFAGLWSALDAIEPAADRAALLDGARAALDRGARRIVDAASRLVAGTFWIEGVVADGPSSTVFRVRHRDLGTLHALKTLRDGHASDPVRTRLLLREARHHLGVRHDGVTVAGTALRLDDGRPALLMELVEGSSLADVLDAGPLDLPEVVALGLRLAAALDAIHATGVAHLDITPANILLPGGDVRRAKVCDFGLSLAFGARRGADDVGPAGTPGFMAPEQADAGWPVDPRADIFALGRVLARGGGERADDHPAFAALLARLRAADSAARPALMADVVQELASCAAAQPEADRQQVGKNTCDASKMSSDGAVRAP